MQSLGSVPGRRAVSWRHQWRHYWESSLPNSFSWLTRQYKSTKYGMPAASDELEVAAVTTAALTLF